MPEAVISYPPELPVSAAREEIAAAIADNQVVIVAGATGSGKTTQLAKICLELGRKHIAHTQPRRIAARSIAARVAEETQTELGDVIGYRVRFEDKTGPENRVVIMTDGVLLNEIHRDRLLKKYDTIIIDEAHERSLNIDFLLGYLRQILPKRPELRVIITSATIDLESFAEYFATASGRPAPIIEVSGRTHPVEIRYRESDEEDGDEVSALKGALNELEREGPGDVLVFLPGEGEIRDAADAIKGWYRSSSRPVEVLPLFGRLSPAEQQKIFKPSSVAGVSRRIILATNVAETSITVPGIRYVIDTGTARISRFSTRAKVQRLPIEAISQASAAQRSGRAGRTAPGVAIRLYSEEDFLKRDAFTEAEIRRTSLAAVVLQMLSLGFYDISSFEFLTPPDTRGIKAALDLLLELGAVVSAKDNSWRLTRIGREMAQIPLETRFSRMLIEARKQEVLPQLLPIVAALSIQDVRLRPGPEASASAREKAAELHRRFEQPESDFLSILKLWNYLQEKNAELSSSAFRRMCQNEFLHYVRVREWFDLHRQLRGLLQMPKASGAAATFDDSKADAIHKSLLAGLLSHIGVLDQRSEKNDAAAAKKKGPRKYRGAANIAFYINPGSALKNSGADSVMAAELVETSRLYARTVAKIDPEWAQQLAPDLCRSVRNDPHWSRKAGAAVCYENVTLYGVPIVSRRRVKLASSDPAAARELFVMHALVLGDWAPNSLNHAQSGFLRRNRDRRRELERQEERSRRRDILISDESLAQFYLEKIPAEVTDAASFAKWWRRASTEQPRLLDISSRELAQQSVPSDQTAFPGRWVQGEQVLQLQYRFSPGDLEDGVTAVVPLPILAQLEQRGFDWQVPGLREDLVTALLRALPKTLRRLVVPASDWAKKLIVELADLAPEHHDGLSDVSLSQAIAKRLQLLAGQVISPDVFDLARVPDHLFVNFRVVDERGKTLGISRDLAELQQRLAAASQASVTRTLANPKAAADAAAPAAFLSEIAELQDQSSWTFGNLAEQIDTKVPGGTVRGYPALTSAKNGASLEIFTSAAPAQAAHRAGLASLLIASTPSESSYVLDSLTQNERLLLAAAPYRRAQDLIEDTRAAIADELIGADAWAVRDGESFALLRDKFLALCGQELLKKVSAICRLLQRSRDIERLIKERNSLALMGALGDIRAQLNGLIFAGFVRVNGYRRIADVDRYLQGIEFRLNNLATNAGRDRGWMSEFERAWQMFVDAGGTTPLPDSASPQLHRTRWLLEELRISLFAQSIGTAETVSVQRIAKALNETK